MAFGGLRNTFKNSATSIGTSIAASGSQAVRLGDLIFVLGGEQTTPTITGVTDNLGNSYTSTDNSVNDAGTSTGRAFWARVKDDGTLTTVTIACNGGTNNGVIVVAIIEGPITNAIDKNPANAANADLSSPFVCPTTGTLSQANEIVIGWLVGTGSTANTATSPNLLADQQATASILHATIGYQAVTVTTAVTPTFAAGSNPTDQLMGVASFRRDDTPLGAGRRLGMQWLPTPVAAAWPASFQIWTESGLSLGTAPTEDTTNLPSVATWGPPPPDVRHPQALITWAKALNVPLNEVVAAPFNQLSWPNPLGFAVKNGTWVVPSRDLAPPFVPSRWSIPRGFATKGGAWINPAIKAVVTPPDTTNLPSVASGWPVPQALAPTFSFVQRGNALGTVAAPPFNKTNWPNPRALRRSNALLSWSNGLPPIQFVFRVPLIARHNEQSWHVALKPQFVNLLPFAPVPAPPFNQLSWPNPRSLERSAAHRAWVYSSPPVTDPNVYLPSTVVNWTIPASLPPLGQSYTLPRNLPLNAVVVTAPFNKTDWPNPGTAQRAANLSWLSSPHALQRPNIQPFGKSDWTVPPGQAPSSHSFTLAYSLPLNTPAGPTPFNKTDWRNPSGPITPNALRTFIGQSPILFPVEVPPEPEFPPHPPPTDSGGAGIKSGVWKPGERGKRANYRSYRYLTEKEIEQLTGREIRQSARDLRADVRKDPLAEEVEKELAALSRVVDYLADFDRLESSVAELSRAIEYALRARAEAEAEDEEISFLLLS